MKLYHRLATWTAALSLMWVGVAHAVDIDRFDSTPSADGKSVQKGPGRFEVLTDSKGPITIPFRMHHGKPLMDLQLNGKPATLMIDNGILWDQVWLFGSPLVDDLQLKPNESSLDDPSFKRVPGGSRLEGEIP